MTMAAFKPVNSTPSNLSTDDHRMAATSPTTPRPNPPQQPSIMDDATTPTKASFASGLAAQKPLPSSPFPEAVQIPEVADKKLPQRENSQHSRKSRDSDEMDMDDSDAETGAGDDGAGSDDESVSADGTKSGKKKKSQRFYCTDYPPCNLSFTRSEHLARHIR
jgi:C2H2 transcription facotor